MSRNFFQLNCRLFAFATLAAAGTVANAAVIADWKFSSSANLTQDSGPNFYTLQNLGTGVTYGHDAVPDPNEPASGNYASFDGNSYLHTSGNLNLSSYSALTVTWSMELAATGDQYVFAGGSGPTPFSNFGDALNVKVNDSNATQPAGFVGVTDGGNANLKNYPTASGASPQWDSYRATIDLNAVGNVAQVTVYKNNAPDPTTPTFAYTYNTDLNGTSFGNLLFTIGAAGDGSKEFVGKIGEVMIQSGVVVVPEPSSMLLLGCACAAVLIRGRKQLMAVAAARLGG